MLQMTKNFWHEYILQLLGNIHPQFMASGDACLIASTISFETCTLLELSRYPVYIGSVCRNPGLGDSVNVLSPPVRSANCNGSGDRSAPVRSANGNGSGDRSAPVHSANCNGSGDRSAPVCSANCNGSGDRSAPVCSANCNGSGDRSAPVRFANCNGSGDRSRDI